MTTDTIRALIDEMLDPDYAHEMQHCRPWPVIDRLFATSADALRTLTAQLDEARAEKDEWRASAAEFKQLCDDWEKNHDTLDARLEEAKAVLGELLSRAENFWALLQGEHGVRLTSADEDDHNVYGFFQAADKARAFLHQGGKK